MVTNENNNNKKNVLQVPFLNTKEKLIIYFFVFLPERISEYIFRIKISLCQGLHSFEEFLSEIVHLGMKSI